MDAIEEMCIRLSNAMALEVDACISFGCGYMVDKQFRAWVDNFVEDKIAEIKPTWMPTKVWWFLHKTKCKS